MRNLLTAALVALGLCGTVQAQSETAMSAAATDGDPDRHAGRVAIPEAAAMPAGSWLHYGAPWRDIDPGRDDNCGVDFGSTLGAWNGGVWDGRYFWVWASGGHGDGCWNGIMRYDLATGTPEMVVPHEPLNVPLCRASGSGCWYEPYVSDQPYPGSMTDRIAAWSGAFIRPRASHTYNNTVRIGDYIYLPTGAIYKTGKKDNQVWRFDVNDPAGTIERLPDRVDGNGNRIGGHNINWVIRPGLPPLMFSEKLVCQPDMVAGQYNCTNSGIAVSDAKTVIAWDDERQGIWVIDSQYSRLGFAREVDGLWEWDASLTITDPVLDKSSIGLAGLCLVPTDQGINPVIWGANATLIRWDGTSLQTVTAGNAPATSGNAVLNKWTWSEDLGVCLGTWSVNEGFWSYKPDFATGSEDQAAVPALVPPSAPTTDKAAAEIASATSRGVKTSSPPHVPVGLPSAPTPNPALKNNPLSPAQLAERGRQASKSEARQANEAENETTSQADQAADVRRDAVGATRQWWIDPVNYSTFAGHVVRPAPFTPAAWNEPIERLPEAPDYDALCPGPWAELHYRTEEDLASSAVQIAGIVKSGTRNIRVYLHPLTDAAGEAVAYTNKLDFKEANCVELVGVPDGGHKPRLATKVSTTRGATGVIVRGVSFDAGYVNTGCLVSANACPAFVVLHDLDVHNAGHLMGIADPNAPLTYLELRGNTIGPDTGWHVLYLERSIGQFVALGNVFYGSGNSGHALKNLAHQSRLEGNVFSNVGLDGQVLAQSANGKDIIGLFPLDAYACTETVIRNNTFVFRTSNKVRTFFSYRGRRAWGNCDKGQRLANGRWEVWAPGSPEYHDPTRWAAIHAAVTTFDQGYEAAKAEPWLFTHLSEGNTFIAFNALDGVDDTRAAEVNSIRPVADNTIRNALIAEAQALAASCTDAFDRHACFLDGASDGLVYAYEHVSPTSQGAMVSIGKLPRGVPIQAPDAWVERAGVFWGANRFITCSAEGDDCRETTPRPVDAAPRPWDDLEVAHPPRVIMQ